VIGFAIHGHIKINFFMKLIPSETLIPRVGTHNLIVENEKVRPWHVYKPYKTANWGDQAYKKLIFQLP